MQNRDSFLGQELPDSARIVTRRIVVPARCTTNGARSHLLTAA